MAKICQKNYINESKKYSGTSLKGTAMGPRKSICYGEVSVMYRSWVFCPNCIFSLYTYVSTPVTPHLPYSKHVCAYFDLVTTIFKIIKMIYKTLRLSHCLHFHAELGQIPVLSYIHCQFFHAFCKVSIAGL